MGVISSTTHAQTGGLRRTVKGLCEMSSSIRGILSCPLPRNTRPVRNAERHGLLAIEPVNSSLSPREIFLVIRLPWASSSTSVTLFSSFYGLTCIALSGGTETESLSFTESCGTEQIHNQDLWFHAPSQGWGWLVGGRGLGLMSRVHQEGRLKIPVALHQSTGICFDFCLFT